MARQTGFHRDRRDFLKLTAATGSGLVLGFALDSDAAKPSSPTPWRPNAWLQIDDNDRVTVTVAESEMGQGVLTAMPMLIAEELEVDWKQVRIRQAPVDPAFGWQGTGGSTSVRQGWLPLREAGAAARQMLIAAAARSWQVAPEECWARHGVVRHGRSGRSASYGALTVLAARESVPTVVRLKAPAEFRLLGKSMLRLDTPPKTDGSAIFGADVRVPGMLYGAITHCPVFGGKLLRVNSSFAKGIVGVRQIVPLESAVAVVGDCYWSARKGLQALQIEWEPGVNTGVNSALISNQLRNALQADGEVVRERRLTAAEQREVVQQIEAVYETPYQAHATMEPMGCTAEVYGDRCTIWAPTQQPTGLQREVARLLTGQRDPGREALQRVTVNTTLLGGGFGRRNLHDFAIEAVKISRAIKAPVQLLWSREEDMQHGFYHPATAHRLRAGLDGQGRIIGWEHKQCGSAHTSGAEELPYSLIGQRLEKVMIPAVIPSGPWRSVSHAYTAYAVECFIDELAMAAGHDPYFYRMTHMHDQRLRAVLRLAADKAGWGKRLPKGHHRGIAAHVSFGSYVAEVVELSVNDDGNVRVHRVVCAVDCGMVVNPDTVVAQMEGSVVYALTAALKGAITITGGRVEQSNFHDYPLWRMEDMPGIDVHIVPSRADPGGVGEPGVPPLAPALANAVYAATGRRIRHLPITLHDLRRG